jgi:hypothetical protein
MQGLETTAIDPNTGDEPLGVDSVMNIELSWKILPYGGEETSEQKHSRRRVALSAKDRCDESRRCLGTLAAEASRASRALPDLNALILYSHPRRPYVRVKPKSSSTLSLFDKERKASPSAIIVSNLQSTTTSNTHLNNYRRRPKDCNDELSLGITPDCMKKKHTLNLDLLLHRDQASPLLVTSAGEATGGRERGAGRRRATLETR